MKTTSKSAVCIELRFSVKRNLLIVVVSARPSSICSWNGNLIHS